MFKPKRGRKGIAATVAKSTACVTALLGVVLGLSGAPAGAATTYWSFDNEVRGCLAATAADHVLETACSSGSTAQDWDWIGSGTYQNLRNRATGRCLMTDTKSGIAHANAIWTSACDSSASGQLWHWEFTTAGTADGELLSAVITEARTSPGQPESVYADDFASVAENPSVPDIPLSYYTWSASTTTG